MPFLKYSDEGTTKILNLPNDKTVVFGREDYCDFQLKMESEISREHFSVGPGDAPGSFILVDLGSRNGTFQNGRKLGNDSNELKEGDEIRAGTQKFLFLKTLPSSIMKAHPSQTLGVERPQGALGEKMKEIHRREGR